jgi:hypothetical protein
MKQDFQDRIELRRTGVTFESSRQRAKASGRLHNEDNLLVFAVITDPDAS